MIAATKSNLSFKKIINTIEDLKPVNGRLEQIGILKIIQKLYWIMHTHLMH